MVTVFALESVNFVSQKGVETKKTIPPVKVFFFGKFTTVIFPVVFTAQQHGVSPTNIY